MKLLNALNQLSSETELEPITHSQYRRAVCRFGEYLARPALTSDLTAENVNGYLTWLASTYELGAVSLRNHRSGIIRIWHFCHEPLRLAGDCPTKRIRRPKVAPKPVRAWTLDDLSALIEAASTIPGRLQCGIPSRDFLLAWIWVGYETGFRPGDMRLLKWDCVDFSSRLITICQHKTSSIHCAEVGEQSIQYLGTLKSHGQSRVFPLNKFGVYRWESILFERDRGFGFQRQERQGLGTLRKTHATEIYKRQGLEAAAESLGHKSGSQTAKNHYVDSRASRRVLPPSPRKRA